MAISTMTAESLSKTLGTAVPDVYVMIAKNSVAGLDSSAIADMLGSTREEIDACVQDQVYKDVRLLIAAEHANTQTEKDFTWDEIEAGALQKLAKRVQYENDSDMLLKIAAVANKAQRRNQGAKVLDPSNAAGRVPLQLSRRIVERLGRDGSREREETQQISVLDGTAINPKFEDIDSILGVTTRAPVPEMKSVTHTPDDFSVDDLIKDLAEGARARKPSPTVR